MVIFFRTGVPVRLQESSALSGVGCEGSCECQSHELARFAFFAKFAMVPNGTQRRFGDPEFFQLCALALGVGARFASHKHECKCRIEVSTTYEYVAKQVFDTTGLRTRRRFDSKGL